MAEGKRQPRMRCQTHYLPDRHVPQKMLQVYQWLVPEPEGESAQPDNQLSSSARAKDHGHLRSSFL